MQKLTDGMLDDLLLEIVREVSEVKEDACENSGRLWEHYILQTYFHEV